MSFDNAITPIFARAYFLERERALNQFFSELREFLSIDFPLVKAFEQAAGHLDLSPLKKALFDSALPKLKSGSSLANSLSGMRFRSNAGLTIPYRLAKEKLDFLACGEKLNLLPETLEVLTADAAAGNRVVLRNSSSPYNTSQYFAGVLVQFALISIFLITYILPTFVDLCKGMNLQLPFISRMFVYLANLLSLQFLLIALFLAILASLFFIKAPSYKDFLLLNLPFAGKIFAYQSYARFSKGLALAIKKNVEMPNALDFAANAAQNAIIKRKVLQAKEEAAKGSPLSLALSKNLRPPSFFSWLLFLGEKAGQTGEALDEASTFFWEEIPALWKRLEAVFAVTGSLCLGVLVLFYVLCFFLPMNQLLSMMLSWS